MRKETDFIGEVFFGDDDLYGIETERARNNFPFAYKRASLRLTYAMVKIKKAAAETYRSLGVDEKRYAAISEACDRILNGEADDFFVTDAMQGGAGTPHHMNVNEVVANMALRVLGAAPGSYDQIHPLDNVNRGQSTNDVYPTALRITAIEMLRELSEECAKLQESLQKKENEFGFIDKLGRTELMDAVPVTLGEEFGSYAQAIARDRWRLYKIEERLRQVNIGGTAVGNSDNTLRKYCFGMIETLRQMTGIGLAAAEYPMDITQNNDVFVEVSGLLKALAVNLFKIANDLRLMNSGPHGGFAEIRLRPMQAGSTIMPGKVNPVIPEAVMEASMKVMANDTAITMAAAHGEFELNAFLPLIADCLIESLSLMEKAVLIFRTKCVDLIEADEKRCQELLAKSCAFATAYTPLLGYGAVSDILKDCGFDPQKARAALEKAVEKK